MFRHYASLVLPQQPRAAGTTHQQPLRLYWKQQLKILLTSKVVEKQARSLIRFPTSNCHSAGLRWILAPKEYGQRTVHRTGPFRFPAHRMCLVHIVLTLREADSADA